MTAFKARQISVRLMTPPGAGAIGVIRVIGPDAPSLVSDVFRPNRGQPLTQSRAGLIRFGRCIDAGEVIDDVLACVVSREPTPTVEMSCHGGVRVVERILQILENRGATFQEGFSDGSAAWPTENAIEREIIEALIRAKTERAARFFARQRRSLVKHVEQVLECMEHGEESGRAALEALLAESAAAMALIDGVTVAIVGPINTGKSTLFNRLVGRAAAIVSPAVGTTRDWIEATVELDGFPVALVDTAGTNDLGDTLERVAIQSGRERIRAADLLIGLVDGTSPGVLVQLGQLQEEATGRAILLAVNKCDMVESPPVTHRPWRALDPPPVELSAVCGEGFSDLLSAVQGLLGIDRFDDESPAIFNRRQVCTVSDALSDGFSADNPAQHLRQTLLYG